MLLYLALAALAFFVYWEFLWPYIIYPIQSRLKRCGAVTVKSSIPFGFPFTITCIKQLRKDQLLRYFAARELKNNVETFWRENLFRWSSVTRDAENLKAISATQFWDFSSVTRSDFMGPVFGSGIFTQDGSEWKHSRLMLRPQFSKEQISRSTDSCKHVDTFIEQVAKEDNKVEIQRFFHLLTMDTATEFSFGESVDSLKFSEYSSGAQIEDPETGEIISSAEFVESYTFLNKYVLQKLLFNSLNSIVDWKFPEHKMHQRRANAFIDHYVRRALDITANDKAPEDSYIFSYELAKSTRDPIVIRDQIFNISIAGRDTTASTLAFSFYYFAKYPEMWEKVKEDVWETFPDGSDTQFTYEGLRRLHYLPLFVKEVLRLSPVVALNMRTAVRDTTSPRGGGPDESKPVFVPKGTVSNYSSYIMHRHPKVYGPTANEFDPDRWLPENKIPGSPMYSWGYIPFNGGPRICLGQQFALTELYVVIAKSALTYDKVLPGKGFSPELVERQTLTAMVGGSGVPVESVPYEQ